MRLKFCALLALYLGLTFPAFAGFEEGKAAYDAGDLDTARQEWLPLAEAGNAEAQFWMGKLYHPSKKEFTDIDQAIYWYSLAAEQNYKKAQINLVFSYMKKKPHKTYVDDVIKWLTIVTHLHKDEGAIKMLNHLKEELPEKLLEQGTFLGEEWLKGHPISN